MATDSGSVGLGSGPLYGSCRAFGAKQVAAAMLYKKTEYYPLRPPRFVRPFLVFTPPLLLVALCELLLNALTPGQVPPWAAAGVAVTWFLLGLLFVGNIAAYWQLEQVPSERELAAEGGRYFVRPSDGQRLEYFAAGAAGSRTVVLLLTPYGGTVGVQWMRKQVGAVLGLKGATLVCPSFPGVAASEPYATCNAAQMLYMHTGDMVALLDSLDAQDVYVVGMAWAAQPCFSLAEALVPGGRLRGVASLSGTMFNTSETDYLEVSQQGAVRRLWSSVTADVTLARPIAYFFTQQCLGLMTRSAARLLSADDIGDMKKLAGDDLGWFVEGSRRSCRWFLHQWWFMRAASLEAQAQRYVDFGRFPPAVPIHLHRGAKDTRVPPSVQTKLKAAMPHAQIMEHDGGHFHMDVAAALTCLFEQP